MCLLSVHVSAVSACTCPPACVCVCLHRLLSWRRPVRGCLRPLLPAARHGGRRHEPRALLVGGLQVIIAFVAAGRRCAGDLARLWHRRTFRRQQPVCVHSSACVAMPSDHDHGPTSYPNPMPKAMHALTLLRTAAAHYEGAPA
jgi:hypothetical protein